MILSTFVLVLAIIVATLYLREAIYQLSEKLDTAIVLLLAQGNQIMTEVNDAVNRIVDAFDVETNRIAAKLDSVVAALDAATKTGGLSADETAALSARLTTEVSRLQSIGADPANPVPPVPEA